MNRQKSFQNEDGPALFLVPTPIGNRSELSPRALETLNKVDVIACEDTRTSGTLLKSLGISKPLIAHHEHNYAASTPGIVQLLEQGKRVAVISDAGYPLISDPGRQLVEAVTSLDIPVISMSGPNAALNALVASGLDTRHYLFYGFLDTRSKKRKEQLETLRPMPYTLLFYEAPHRIEETLADCLEVLGDRPACLARELTKVHEEYLRGTLSEILAAAPGLKGEMVLVISGADPEEDAVTLEEAVAKAQALCAQGIKPRKAAEQAAKDTPFSKNEIYQAMLAAKDEA